MSAMAKLPAVMDIFGHVKDYNLKESDGKFLLTLKVKDGSAIEVYIKTDIASKEQAQVIEKIKELLK